MGNEAFWFEQTDTPKTGDVMFRICRGPGCSNHWALVKDYDATTGIITCLSRTGWNGQAGINRQIPIPPVANITHRGCSGRRFWSIAASGRSEPVGQGAGRKSGYIWDYHQNR